MNKPQLTQDQIKSIVSGMEESLMTKKAEIIRNTRIHGAGYQVEDEKDFNDLKELERQISFWKSQL